ncbi:MAG: hypothetical protein U0L61_00915, partial [Alistipes sp.]|nr:hypothetical protein [Alistipes sp.]
MNFNEGAVRGLGANRDNRERRGQQRDNREKRGQQRRRDAGTQRQQREVRTTERKETRETTGTTGRSADNTDNREKNNKKKMMLDFVLVSFVSHLSLFVIARAARLVAIS